MKIDIPLALLTAALLLLGGCGTQNTNKTSLIPAKDHRASTPIRHSFDPLQEPFANPFSDLSVPTYVTKIGEEYFIVDCYHNQVIYHNNLTDPISAWSVMTDQIVRGHTIASDGTVYLIDDTENHRILIMERQVNQEGQAVFLPTQEFTRIGNRPHYIVYDDATDTFYAFSSLTGEMYLFRRDPAGSTVYLTEVRSVPSLMGVYVRSFTIIENIIYFVSGNSSIVEADLHSFCIRKEYPVPKELAGMIQITQIEDDYYITVSTDASGSQDYATMIRTADLADLAEGRYEDVYSHFIGGGTPYYMTQIENRWFLTEHRIPGHSIWSFSVKDSQITDVISVY